MPRPSVPRVRRARLGDLGDLVALEERCFRGDRLSARQYRAHVASERAWLGVAERDGAAVGSALVMFRADTRAARLYSIAVDPTARGGGVGLALLRAAERAARRHGANEMRLEVRADNAAAIALYEREGYARFGRRRRYYEDGADALRYSRPLRRP
ncbi:MAG TPA: ribosomal protein S18-alanine N-acetyltransferase [Xanthomonadales bacterium]|nr:ribosomal protein S18-alanine N-acetyltransferase [Xanthomonadales bacterium]